MNNFYNGITIFSAVLLLFCCIGPFIPVEIAPFLTILGLGVPIIILVNLFLLLSSFFLRKKVAWLTLGALILAILSFGSFYRFNNKETPVSGNTFSAMSFNVRNFNSYFWIENAEVAGDIIQLILDEDPDILCLQEFSRYFLDELDMFPYHYANPYSEDKSDQVIFSKYPILDAGSLDFSQSRNNTIFADLLINGDTLRVYNIHLQSFHMTPSRKFLYRLGTGKIYSRIAHTFIKQEKQVQLLRHHMSSTTNKKLLCGDLNNTQFSRTYHLLKGKMKDSFMEKGSGLGTTFMLRSLPLRIDAILADPSLEILSHKNFNKRLSDHYPLKATFRMP